MGTATETVGGKRMKANKCDIQIECKIKKYWDILGRSKQIKVVSMGLFWQKKGKYGFLQTDIWVSLNNNYV
jgi:hypothetical protein